ncbi:MAG: thrombospondin type 3 repeat-containing protein [Polyangiaceae bacterium]|nr:thrombospondin type 3 repeat-containing protein [Polyangiaceae bacterium]
MLSASATLLGAGTVLADAVLHPGTINGTTGLSNWAFDQGYASVSGNSAGFSASVNFTGNAFAMTIEGNQTYSYAYTQNYKFTSGGSLYFYQSFNNLSIAVPENGQVAVDLSRPGASIVPAITVTGGTLQASHFEYTVYDNNSYAQLQAERYDATLVPLPVVAGFATQLRGFAKVAVSDGVGGTLCVAQVSLGATTFNLAEGDSAAANYALTVDQDDCDVGIQGTVGVNNAPGGMVPTSGYVYAYGYTPAGAYLGSFSQNLTGNNQDYQLVGLPEGKFYPQASVNFPNGASMQLPNQNPPFVDVAAGMSQRDFVFDGGIANGNLALTGPFADRLQWANVSYAGQYDYNVPNYGPTAGGSSTAPVSMTTGEYSLVLTPGDWRRSYVALGFMPDATGIQTYNYVYLYDNNILTTAQAGATNQLPSTTIPTSSGVIVFDVIEPPGAPTEGISNPYIHANRYDSVTGQTIYAYSYAYVQNAATPSVRVVGVPGTYTFQAFATVKGSQSKFAESTITLGAATPTPTGTHVLVVPNDQFGNPGTVQLDFAQVTGEGSTTLSITDIGPAAPDGYDLLKVIALKEYLNISTSANFPGEVELCITYDPVALGLTTADEETLKLQQYVCLADVCEWEIINGTFDGSANPDTVNNVVCGTTTSLSTFSITLPTDNCPGVNNPDQLDTDTDGVGDACDTDIDNDGVLNTNDNCPTVVNVDQANTEGDGEGDVCDTDDDNDGVLDTNDICPVTANADQADVDGDGVGDACDQDADGDGIPSLLDNCPTVVNQDQLNSDTDGLGDACDGDDDNDSVADASDNCPTTSNANQADLDGDNIGDFCDADIDGDSLNNGVDNCPILSNSDQANSDTDAQGDACDADDDNDFVMDGADNCQVVANADQLNADLDGQGDACDGDDDNDTLADGADNCPLVANATQEDTDADNAGDACDPDLDGDGVANATDNCPALFNLNQDDFDGDNVGDACDGDLDGDGVPNNVDNCVIVANAGQSDLDNDLLGDGCDSDMDGDGVLNTGDNCVALANANQADNENDGIGDVCDPDDDNDNIADTLDNCPIVANTNQINFDGDGLGDACDGDDDNDAVLDAADECADTPLGTVVAPANGCSVDQLCPCATPRGQSVPWTSHSAYVACAVQATASLVSQGLMTTAQKNATVATFAAANCPPAAAGGDTDGDGVANSIDNCPTVPNATQNPNACLPGCITIQRGVAGNVFDSYLSSVNAGWAPGVAQNYMVTGGTTKSRALVQFDLSVLPQYSYVTSATVTVSLNWSATTTTMRVHRVLNPWLESTVSFANFGGVENFSPAVEASFSAGSLVVRSFDLTGLVSAWANGDLSNRGILFEEDLGQTVVGRHEIYASESTAVTRRPKLDVCYAF